MNKANILVIIALIAAILLRFHKEVAVNTLPDITSSENAIPAYNQTNGGHRRSLKRRSTGSSRHAPPYPYPTKHF